MTEDEVQHVASSVREIVRHGARVRFAGRYGEHHAADERLL
jgi:hypothetical protein